MNNKGVSAVIATILILMIAIALSGTAYIYFSGIVSGRTKNTISISSLNCDSTGNITIALRNDGTANLVDSDIQVLINNVDRSDNYDFGTIGPQETVIAYENATVEGSGDHSILIVSPSNSVRENINC